MFIFMLACEFVMKIWIYTMEMRNYRNCKIIYYLIYSQIILNLFSIGYYSLPIAGFVGLSVTPVILYIGNLKNGPIEKHKRLYIFFHSLLYGLTNLVFIFLLIGFLESYFSLLVIIFPIYSFEITKLCIFSLEKFNIIGLGRNKRKQM